MSEWDPGVIRRPCEVILSSYEDQLIEVLTNRFEIAKESEMMVGDYINYKVAYRFCNSDDSITRACFGINPK